MSTTFPVHTLNVFKTNSDLDDSLMNHNFRPICGLTDSLNRE